MAGVSEEFYSAFWLRFFVDSLLRNKAAACSTHHSDEYSISISERTLEKVNSIIENEIKPNAY
ncbi:hypothetical protein IG557_18500, partial [Vibrio cholerae]|nr:hypothetical protein [Vibrio cholerae]